MGWWGKLIPSRLSAPWLRSPTKHVNPQPQTCSCFSGSSSSGLQLPAPFEGFEGAVSVGFLLNWHMFFLVVGIVIGVAGTLLITHFFFRPNKPKSGVPAPREASVRTRRATMVSLLRESPHTRRKTLNAHTHDDTMKSLKGYLDETLTPVENAASLMGALLVEPGMAAIDRSILTFAINTLKLDRKSSQVPLGWLKGGLALGIPGDHRRVNSLNSLSSVDSTAEGVDTIDEEEEPSSPNHEDDDEISQFLLNHYTQLPQGNRRHVTLKGLAKGIAFAIRLRTNKNGVAETVHEDRMVPFIVGEEERVAICDALQGVDEWGWDILRFKEATKDRELQVLGWYLLHEWGLVDKFHIDRQTLRNWLGFVESAYVNTNSYHNATHATDVLQTVHYMLKRGGASALMSEIDILSLFLGAMAHDAGHDGRTNDFHKNTLSERAIEFNDQSIQENYHASTVFRATFKYENLNIFSGMEDDQARMLRSAMIEMILKTDMSKHFEKLEAFKKIVEDKGSDREVWQNNREILLDFILHSCDISNPAKPFALAEKWAESIMEEFFAQGDEERTRKIPISPLCNRETTQLAKSQIMFIKFIVIPTYKALGELLPAIGQTTISCVNENLYRWTLRSANGGQEKGSQVVRRQSECMPGIFGKELLQHLSQSQNRFTIPIGAGSPLAMYREAALGDTEMGEKSPHEFGSRPLSSPQIGMTPITLKKELQAAEGIGEGNRPSNGENNGSERVGPFLGAD